MKFAVVFAALFAVAFAASAPGQEVLIKSLINEVNEQGFQTRLETSDGTVQVAQGQLKQFDKDTSAVVVQGQFSYVADDGLTYTVKYTADEFGYHPEGAHLPVAPEA